MLLASGGTLSSSGPNSRLRAQGTGTHWASTRSVCLPRGRRAFSSLSGHPTASMVFPRARATSSGFLLGYPAGAREMAVVRGAAAKTRRRSLSATARRSEGTQACTRPRRAPHGRRPARPPAQSPLPRPHLAAPAPRPPAPRPPGNPGACASRRVLLRATAGGGRRGAGRRPPARHLPSSLSSTIISGAPCPAAARLDREKGADSGRASAGRPVLGQRAGSNYPLVRLLT